MAAVTVNARQEMVWGNARAITFDVNIANDADTLATGLQKIIFCVANSQAAGNNNIGLTVSGGTLTCQTAGAETNALIVAVGF